MFRRLIFPALAALLAFQPASAREVFTRTWVENGVKWTETTVVEVEEAGSERLVGLHQPPARKGLANFGPFTVLDDTRAALVAETDKGSVGTTYSGDWRRELDLAATQTMTLRSRQPGSAVTMRAWSAGRTA